jgi:hypothetical protein
VQAASARPAGLTRRARAGAICNPLAILKIPDENFINDLRFRARKRSN